MRAVVIDRYGSAEEFAVREIARPQCDDGEMLVRVLAAGVNPVDWKIRDGTLRWILPASFPLVLGFDIAGEVVESRVEGDQPGTRIGDQVFCFLDQRHGGGYAEFATVGADASAPKPEQISFEEAAATPLAGSTALQALCDLGHLQSGQHVLVNGASGGVGTFAVQIATALGAEVTGTCSESNLDLVRDLGARHVIDYRRHDFVRSDRRYDIVLDAVAQRSYRECRRVLKRGGTYITTLPSARSLFSQLASWFSGKKCKNVMVQPRRDDLELLAKLIDAGEVRPLVQEMYPLEDAAAAHRTSEEGHVRGKLVLKVQ